MPFYYITANKRSMFNSNKYSEATNLHSSMYQEMDALDTLHTKLSQTYPAIKFSERPVNFDPKHQVLLKVEVSSFDLKWTTFKTELSGRDVTVFYNEHDQISLSKTGNEKKGFPIKIIAQVMPDGSERTKKDAIGEEAKTGKKAKGRPDETQFHKNKEITSAPVKSQKDHAVLRAFTFIAQKIIDVNERNVGKEEPPKPSKRI